MDTLLGFHVGFWDYVTFVSLAIVGIAFLGLVVFILEENMPVKKGQPLFHRNADQI